MRVVLLYNPRSGRGRSAKAAAMLVSRLSAAGIGVRAFELGAELDMGSVAQEARGADALVVAGGDGSVHHVAPAAVEAGTPLYHFPLGTENLFAREFGSSSDPDRLISALRSRSIFEADVGTCNGRSFVLMAGVGFDAHVVERVAAERVTGVRRTDYLRQAAREFREIRCPLLSIRVDGRPLAEDESGLLIVANSAQYAARFNPCADARVDDGLLDVLFLPYRSRSRLASWMVSIGLGMHLHAPDARNTRARVVDVRSSSSSIPHQLDGESIGASPGPLNLHMRVESRRLRVLRPME